MAHLQLTMQAGFNLPTDEEGNELKEKILALPIPKGTTEIIFTEKQANGQLQVLKILVYTQAAKG